MQAKPVKISWKVLLAAATVVVAAAVATGPAAAVVPVDGGDPGDTTIAINNGSGDQTEPHVGGDLAVYTSNDGSSSTIRYFDFLAGSDSLVPVGAPGDNDVLSDVNGSRIVFSRTRAVDSATAAMLFDVSSGVVTELDPSGPGSVRFGTVIGGDTVVWAEFATGVGEIFVYDLAAGTRTSLTQPSANDTNPSVAPGGDVVVWERCVGFDCDIYASTRSGGGWEAPTLVAGTSANEANPDSDGTTIVYDSTRPSPTDQDIYFQPIAGGAETQLELPGFQRNPAISAGVVSFESSDGLGAQTDLFAYVIATNTVYRVTDTPAVDETLNDVTVLPNGAVRVVWAANDDAVGGLHNVYARTFTLPGAEPAPPPADPGDILVVDPDTPPVSTAVLFEVDPQTGARTVLSNFGTGNPTAVAVEADGNILVTDSEAGTDPSGGTSEWGVLYRLSRDPVTDELVRTILTDFGVGPNTGRNPRAVTVETDGQILVTTGLPGTFNDMPLLVRVDPVTGARSIVSDFRDSSQGVLGIEPRGVAVEEGGTILAIDAQGGTSALGELFRIDPQTGARTSVSNFGTGPLNGINPTSVAVETNGQILVTDEGHGSLFPLGLLLRIDPQTGVRTILSDLNIAPNTGREPEGVAIEANGQILVVDKHAGPLGRGTLFRVDPQTGARQIVSDFGDSGQGTLGDNPLAVAVVPRELATLIVTKGVVNDNGGTARPSDFTITVEGSNPFPASFPGKDPCPVPSHVCPVTTTVVLEPGPYSVSESGGPPGYSGTFSPDCSGTIAAGETKTCVIANDDQPATLTVIKEVVNDNGGGAGPEDFTITVNGPNPNPASLPGSAAGTAVSLDAGAYTVTESGPAGYTGTFSVDCASEIGVGEEKTCTITNDDEPTQATLTVITEVVNDNGGIARPADWTISVIGGNPSPSTFAGAPAPGISVTLDASAYTVTLGGPAGYNSMPSIDCEGTIAPGETKTCTLTLDDRQATLTVIKEMINDNGGSAVAGDFTLAVNGPNANPASFPGSAAGTAVSLDAGAYTVTETGPAGYTSTASVDCASEIGPGEEKTCTITNDDRPPSGQVCNGLPATIVGGPGDSQLVGTSGGDVIVDLGGNNTISGRGGNDTICTGPGNDTITAGTGNDTVIDTGGTNTVEGGAGNDTITTGDGDDTINAGDGDDTINAGDSRNGNSVNGQAGDDTIISGNETAGALDDRLDGGDGNDTITDTAGRRARVDGGAGDDTITTGDGADTINAGNGDDTINAGNGTNTVNGQDGDDTITTGDSDDTINGGQGFDTCTPGGGTNTVIRCEAVVP